MPPAPKACDCHVHVFDPGRFPYASSRSYTPAAASTRQLRDLHQALAVERVVLVQPSVYGTDNRCLLQALQELGSGRARGIAVLDLAKTSEAELWALHEAGVRGLRLNLHVSGADIAAAQAQIKQAGRLRHMPGWNVQVHASFHGVGQLLDELLKLEMPVVLDHYACWQGRQADSERNLSRVLAEMRQGRLYVKLSAPYRLPLGTEADQPWLAREFQSAAPQRVLWGSDWPHTGGSGQRTTSPDEIEPFREIDNGKILGDLLACLPDDQARHQLLVDNPAHLYGFGI